MAVGPPFQLARRLPRAIQPYLSPPARGGLSGRGVLGGREPPRLQAANTLTSDRTSPSALPGGAPPTAVQTQLCDIGAVFANLMTIKSDVNCQVSLFFHFFSLVCVLCFSLLSSFSSLFLELRRLNLINLSSGVLPRPGVRKGPACVHLTGAHFLHVCTRGHQKSLPPPKRCTISLDSYLMKTAFVLIVLFDSRYPSAADECAHLLRAMIFHTTPVLFG